MEFFSGKILCAGLIGAVLSGCVSMSGNSNVAKDFECPAAQGEGCVSIGDIRNRIATSGARMTPIYRGGAPAVSVSGVPQWKADEILKIHIGDYVDANGIYHDNGTVYVVASQGGWEVD